MTILNDGKPTGFLRRQLNGKVIVLFMKPPSISPQLLTQPSTWQRPKLPGEDLPTAVPQEELDILHREFMSYAHEILGPYASELLANRPIKESTDKDPPIAVPQDETMSPSPDIAKLDPPGPNNSNQNTLKGGG